ncbi:MAG: aminodeoxychorismate synthase component I [Paludibacter sp.]
MSELFPYKIQDKQQIVNQINELATLQIPFLFIIDYEAKSGFVIKKDELDENYIQFSIRNTIPIAIGNETRNTEHETRNAKPETIKWNILPISLKEYQQKFNYVQSQIHKGNSFLTNLTQPTEIETNLSLLDIYHLGSAKYKLWLKGKFTLLSPETYVHIQGQTISSFPMKGTIDADIQDAENIILNDPKEKAEHATIVDLIRNDLSLVATDVEVKRYRYVEKITTNQQDLLQVSSEISGQLPFGFHDRLGNILFALLPAGSICGAPKSKTVEIIQAAEGYERGFYSGIFGYFDGKNLDSAVMIRFIEQDNERLIFKSGGGITAQSDMMKEYEELKQKVYVPIS